jgi:thiamine biosynthesis lipoprotein
VTETARAGRRVEQVMGMPVVVDVRDPVAARGRLLDEVFDWFREVDGRFSPYLPDSEVSRLGRGELALADAHADVRLVYRLCEELRLETDGYFDVSVVGGDPSGFVKGWAVDRAEALLADGGAENFAVYAGGDMVLRGGALPERTWRIGIQHPRLRDRVARVLEVRDLAVATSGAYERGDHVLDPHTRRRPPAGVLSVTIAGGDLATADAYATAAFAMGAGGLAWTSSVAPYEALTILADETAVATPGFPAPAAV